MPIQYNRCLQFMFGYYTTTFTTVSTQQIEHGTKPALCYSLVVQNKTCPSSPLSREQSCAVLLTVYTIACLLYCLMPMRLPDTLGYQTKGDLTDAQGHRQGHRHEDTHF